MQRRIELGRFNQRLTVSVKMLERIMP